MAAAFLHFYFLSRKDYIFIAFVRSQTLFDPIGVVLSSLSGFQPQVPTTAGKP